MDKDNISLIRDLANIKIDEILDALGIIYKEKYHSYVSQCPIHNGDRRDAFSWHIDRGIWKCFSRGCEEPHGCDVFGLVKGVKEISFTEAVEFVKKFVNLSMTPEELQKLKDEKSNKEFILAAKRKAEKARTYPADSLKKLVYHDYLENRGYSRSIIEEYHIGACLTPGMYMSNRIVVPVVNIEGSIVGFTGRTLDEKWKDKGIPKWKHSQGCWKESNLFNIDKAHFSISETGEAIICEGPLDVLKLVEAGVTNAVAILGKDIHNEQLTILMNAGAHSLLLALDNDKAGALGTNKALRTASSLFSIRTAKIPSNRKDVGEMTKEEIEKVFKKCINTNVMV